MCESLLLKYMERINEGSLVRNDETFRRGISAQRIEDFKKYQLVSSVYELNKKLFGYSIVKGLVNSTTEELEEELEFLLTHLELLEEASDNS